MTGSLQSPEGLPVSPPKKPTPPIRYCLYARKSSEAEERQALSIESQIKEMRSIARRDNLLIVEVKTESHSAKKSGGRWVFNKMLDEIQRGKYNGILTWAADRLSRNAGDLGRLVDLIDGQQLTEIRTCNQIFTNSPNEKFLLMILGSQAKLENDNKGLNVKRGLRAVVSKGLWPSVPPTGYRLSKLVDQKGRIRVDPARAHIIKMMFEKAADDWSHRRIWRWLTKELEFIMPSGKPVTLSEVQIILNRTFYYGVFEYPKGSGQWYKGIHQPIITKALYEAAQESMKKRRKQNRIFRKNFAYTRLMKCGRCGSGITASEKFKALKDGSISVYIYYGCTRAKDKNCKTPYIRENDLIKALCDIVDQLSIDELGVRGQMEMEVDRLYRFHRDVMGNPGGYDAAAQRDVDIKKYVKYLLAEGTLEEKRHILLNLQSRLILNEKKIYFDTTMEGTDV